MTALVRAELLSPVPLLRPSLLEAAVAGEGRGAMGSEDEPSEPHPPSLSEDECALKPSRHTSFKLKAKKQNQEGWSSNQKSDQNSAATIIVPPVRVKTEAPSTLQVAFSAQPSISIPSPAGRATDGCHVALEQDGCHLALELLRDSVLGSRMGTLRRRRARCVTFDLVSISAQLSPSASLCSPHTEPAYSTPGATSPVGLPPVRLDRARSELTALRESRACSPCGLLSRPHWAMAARRADVLGSRNGTPLRHFLSLEGGTGAGSGSGGQACAGPDSGPAQQEKTPRVASTPRSFLTGPHGTRPRRESQEESHVKVPQVTSLFQRPQGASKSSPSSPSETQTLLGSSLRRLEHQGQSVSVKSRQLDQRPGLHSWNVGPSRLSPKLPEAGVLIQGLDGDILQHDDIKAWDESSRYADFADVGSSSKTAKASEQHPRQSRGFSWHEVEARHKAATSLARTSARLSSILSPSGGFSPSGTQRLVSENRELRRVSSQREQASFPDTPVASPPSNDFRGCLDGVGHDDGKELDWLSQTGRQGGSLLTQPSKKRAVRRSWSQPQERPNRLESRRNSYDSTAAAPGPAAPTTAWRSREGLASLTSPRSHHLSPQGAKMLSPLGTQAGAQCALDGRRSARRANLDLQRAASPMAPENLTPSRGLLLDVQFLRGQPGDRLWKHSLSNGSSPTAASTNSPTAASTGSTTAASTSSKEGEKDGCRGTAEPEFLMLVSPRRLKQVSRLGPRVSAGQRKFTRQASLGARIELDETSFLYYGDHK